jgi:uncharacterized membrane protein
VAFGILLAMASLAVLIYFIHHVATSIRIETLLATLAAEIRDAIDRLYPEEIGHSAADEQDRPHLPADFDQRAIVARAKQSGYVQQIDGESLLRGAVEHGLVVRIDSRPGRFVSEGDPLLSACPGDSLSEDDIASLANAVIIGRERTPEQDVEFSVRRIVEIAQRALSPGVNDPTTAVYCIDRIGEVFGRIARRAIPSPIRCDDEGRLRTVTEVASLEELACPAFTAIARYGLEDADVIRRLLVVMYAVGRIAPPAAQTAIFELAEAIGSESENRLKLAFDRQSLRAHTSYGSGRPASR